MTSNGQAELGYKLADAAGEFSSELPNSLESLALWLAERPMLNIDQLLHEIPAYIQEMNQVNLPDKARFKMLEALRPIVAHVHREIIKRFRKEKGVNLSLEFQEMEWLVNVLLREMALGYQRLLFNKGAKKARFYNRSHYAILAERVLYYLSERIAFVYMLHSVVPDSIWHDLNSTYYFSRNNKIDSLLISDDFVFSNDKKYSIEILYKRVLLLTILAPYSLRSAEIEQVYLGVLSLINRIELTADLASYEEGYVINWMTERGPSYSCEINEQIDSYYIDTKDFVKELKTWLMTQHAPDSDIDEGISKKLLREMVSKLNGSLKRLDERIPADGQQVEVIIGLQHIEAFLGHVEALKNDAETPIQEIKSGEFTINHHWNEKSTKGDWDSFSFSPLDGPKPDQIKAKVDKKVEKPIKEPHYHFQIEDESSAGVCLRCDSEQSRDLVLGELLFILGQELGTWTLGIVRWIKVVNKNVNLGVYFLGGEIDFVNVSLSTDSNKSMKALWLQEGQTGATLLLPTTKFLQGDVINTHRQGVDLTLILHEIVWENEVFSQFGFELINFETKVIEPGSKVAKPEKDYLIPSWEK